MGGEGPVSGFPAYPRPPNGLGQKFAFSLKLMEIDGISCKLALSKPCNLPIDSRAILRGWLSALTKPCNMPVDGVARLAESSHQAGCISRQAGYNSQ